MDIQLEALRLAECEVIYQEKESGKTVDNREQLAAALKFARKGDILIVTKLDRLARSLSDLWSIVNELGLRGVDLKVIEQPLIDTSKPEGKLILTMFGYVAETERNLILERTANGRAKAMSKGVKFGAKAKLSDIQLANLKVEANLFEGSKSALAHKYGISRASLYRLLS